MDKTKARNALRMIADDMASDDARAFDGRPFDGRTVAEYFGNQGAAIAAIANIVFAMLDEQKPRLVKFDTHTVASDRE